jgi:microcompartment protein CcmL/EutN
MHFERPLQNRLDSALAALDLASIARGYKTLDAIVKRATVKIDLARAVSSGRFVIVMAGDIAEVEESYSAALEMAGSNLVDHVAITSPHEQLVRALKKAASCHASEGWHPSSRSLLIAEFDTVSTTLRAAEVSLKNCDVQVSSMRLAEGIAGKGVVILHGDLCEIEAATQAIMSRVQGERIVALESIANPHLEISGFL